MSFSSLGLSEPIVRAVSERGYTQPTPIQAQAIPAVLSGGDLLAGAQTGTGKTAGFTLPILQRLSTTAARRNARGVAPIRALVLTPTRELAAQVDESVREYGKYVGLHSMSMFGGVGINPQIDRLKKGVDILVATPGRLLDHVQQKTLDLSTIEILVLDEADRMLDMGFIRDIRRILALLPKQRQNLLFSATFSDDIKALADTLLDKPATIEVARRNATADLVDQRVMLVDQPNKAALLAHLVKEHAWFQVLVFTRMKHRANWLAEKLAKAGIPALAIHGNKSQGARTRALSEFKSGTLQVLVATDIAARGLDIVELPHVVNFELPNVPEDYVHRIGRTGRAGSTGQALSLVCGDEMKFLADIEKLIRRRLPRDPLPAFAPLPATAADSERAPRPAAPPRGRARPAPKTAKSASARARRGSAATTGEQREPRRAAAPEPGRGQPAAHAPRPQVDHKRRNADGEVNGNVAPPLHGVNGNRVEPRRTRDANGSQAAAAPRRDGKPGQPRQDPPSRRNDAPGGAPRANPKPGQPRGLKGALARGLDALRRFAD